MIPSPKQIETTDGSFSFKGEPLEILVPAKEKEVIAPLLVEELKRAGFATPTVLTGNESAEPVIFLRKANGMIPVTASDLPEGGEGGSDPAEAYVLKVLPDTIVCQGRGNAGLFYAAQTLCQLIRANLTDEGRLPCLTIRDWPSMKYRCLQDDLSRGASPLLTSLFDECDLGVSFKHNMFTYYMEDQYEFKKHPKISPKDGSLMQEELRQWVEYAGKRHLTILGCQQSFAHCEKILAVPEYKHLGEAGYILSPTVEEVYPLLDDLYSEVIPLLPFEMFAVCCDETADLAKSGPSKELADEIGVDGVYLQHIKRVHALLKKYDKRMLMSSDIILRHPEKIPELPKDLVAMCWEYEPLPDFDSFIKPFSDSGYDFFVCPGISNWNVMLPLFQKATVNIRNMVRDGCKHGTIGMINTAWEDDGEAIHGYNWYPIAWGAECSWNASTTEPEDFRRRIGPLLFGVKGNEFAHAIELLSQLQSLPEIGYGYNSRFWIRDFTPQSPQNIVEQSAKKILELVRPAIADLETTKRQATVNAELLDSFLLGARRMELIGSRMLDGLEASKKYAAIALLDYSSPENRKQAIETLREIEELIAKNRDAHRSLRDEFARIWISESKPYMLERVTDKYDDLDAWFVKLDGKVREIRVSLEKGATDITIPDIGLSLEGSHARRTTPNKVMTGPLAKDTPWINESAPLRFGVTVEAGNVERTNLPVEVDVPLPEEYRNKAVEAFGIHSSDVPGHVTVFSHVPAQLEATDTPNVQRLTFVLPTTLKKGETATVHVYCGLETSEPLPEELTVSDGANGMKIVENNLIRADIGPTGGHVFHWLLKEKDDYDMTQPGEADWQGFADTGVSQRSMEYELRCLNNGPAMVRYGCFLGDDLYKTLTMYAGIPVLDVITSYPAGYYWNFDNPENFAADRSTQGMALFSNGISSPVAAYDNGNTIGVQQRESNVFWGVKFNGNGMMFGMTTPESPTSFVIGPGGEMGGVGIEAGDGRSHFVTVAGLGTAFYGASPKNVMESLRKTFDLKNQPLVTVGAPERKK